MTTSRVGAAPLDLGLGLGPGPGLGLGLGGGTYYAGVRACVYVCMTDRDDSGVQRSVSRAAAGGRWADRAGGCGVWVGCGLGVVGCGVGGIGRIRQPGGARLPCSSLHKVLTAGVRGVINFSIVSSYRNICTLIMQESSKQGELRARTALPRG